MGENLGYFPIRVEVDASENTSGFVSSRGAMFCQVPATPNPRPNTLTPSPSPSAYPNPSPIPNANPNPDPLALPRTSCRRARVSFSSCSPST